MSDELHPIVTHGEILHAVRELGRKIDILSSHLGADFSREDRSVQAEREAVADAIHNLPPRPQPPKG